MAPQRILHVVGAMDRAGAETMLMAMYRALDRERYQFDFLELEAGRSDYADEIESLGGRIFHCQWSQSPLKLRSTVHSIEAVIAAHGPFAAVHSHVLFASGTVLLAARRAGVATRIAHSHSTSTHRSGAMERGYQTYARGLLRLSATHMAACTGAAGDYLFGARRFSGSPHVVPNAVDVESFRPAEGPERDQLRRALSIPDERLVLVSVARLEPVKNHEFLVAVATELEARGYDFEMFFVGDGRLRSHLEQLVTRQELDRKVRFLGLRNDIPELLRASDLLVMPSLYEGLPVSLVEAQASGLPCLVSDQVSREADLGLGLVRFLAATNPADWADAITHPPASVSDGGVIRRALAIRGYTVDSALTTMCALYELP
ncbi:glycosyltransferase family 1 protein [Actinomycetota bacterium]